MHTTLKAHLSVFLANLIFGVNFSIVKFITPAYIKPFGLNVVRVAVTSSLLWTGFLFAGRVEQIDKKDYLRLTICAISGVTINQLLFIKGLSLTYSTHASLIMLCTPVLITAIAFFILKESAGWMRIAGLITGIAGAAILIFSRDGSGHGQDILLGDILVLLNAISYSIYFVLVKPLLEKYSPAQVQRWVFTIGGIFIFPFGWNELITTDFQLMGWTQWTAIAFVVLGATFIAYMLNTYALQHLKASSTGAYIYTQPFFAGLVSVIFLHEPFSPMKVLAAVLIATGVFMVNYKTFRS